MKTNRTTTQNRALSISILIAAAMPLAGWGAAIFGFPERFGVVDITPNNQSGESYQNSEPSLGVGVGAQYGKMVVHAFSGNYLYANSSSGNPPWTSPGVVSDLDATLDWSTAGTCYLALLPSGGSLNVRKSPDPTTTAFTTIAAATVNGSPDQPWVKVVNVAGVDHIFVGFNDLSHYPGKTASIRYSLDGGTTWSTQVIEKTTPGTGWDSPAVRLAISADGTTVYALFQRATTFLGTTFGSDYTGDVVLMRDDAYGGSGYGALGAGGNGTLVAHNIRLPWSGGTALGAQRLGADCDVAINPSLPSQVYVAYTEIVNGTPVIRVQSSSNHGANFSLVYTINNASLPELAVTSDGTLGLLYAVANGNNLEVHFLKAFSGSFAAADRIDRILARWPNNNPVRTFSPYIGDYFTLRAVGYNFFGTFCASGDPQPTHFPSGVYYERNVKVGATIQHDFWLSSPGSLVDLSGQPVAPSIDPFAFYDIAPIRLVHLPIVGIILPFFYNPIDPYSGITHVSWPMLPQNQPQMQLLTAPSLAPGANWTVAPANTITQANGAFHATVLGPQAQQYYRLSQVLTGAQFNIFASADGNGALSPTGAVAVAAGQNQTFTATPNNYYAVGNWHLDGVVVQSNGPSLTLSNVADEHTVVATFVASNDLAVTIAEFPTADGPTLSFNTNLYMINVENRGLNLLTGVSMSNNLPATLSFASAGSSQGTVNYSAGVVTADLGSLNPGDSAVVTITCLTTTAGSITDTVSVACSQFEPNLANNTATEITAVIDPVIITIQPASQSVLVGGTAFFSVGVSGTPPFTYQWFFNGAPIDSETNSTLTLTSVTVAQAGS